MKYAPKVHASKYECNQALTMTHTQSAARNSQARTMKATEPYHAIFRFFSGEKRWMLFISVSVRLTTDFKHRRTAAFENQRLYGQIECAIGGCLQGIVRPGQDCQNQRRPTWSDVHRTVKGENQNQ